MRKFLTRCVGVLTACVTAFSFSIKVNAIHSSPEEDRLSYENEIIEKITPYLTEEESVHLFNDGERYAVKIGECRSSDLRELGCKIFETWDYEDIKVIFIKQPLFIYYHNYNSHSEDYFLREHDSYVITPVGISELNNCMLPIWFTRRYFSGDITIELYYSQLTKKNLRASIHWKSQSYNVHSSNELIANSENYLILLHNIGAMEQGIIPKRFDTNNPLDFLKLFKDRLINDYKKAYMKPNI